MSATVVKMVSKVSTFILYAGAAINETPAASSLAVRGCLKMREAARKEEGVDVGGKTGTLP
jgi:hypothetical protein